jgi:hypothetical protein
MVPPSWGIANIRQLTDVSRCNLQHHFCCKQHRAFAALARDQPILAYRGI